MRFKRHDSVKITKRSKLKALREKYDDLCETLALAEGGALEEAYQLTMMKKTRRIMVIGIRGSFSKAVVDYALEFSERMSYEIVALSLEGFFRLPPEPVVSLERFVEEAKIRNISVKCVIRRERFEECFKSIEKEVGSVELIISDTVFCSEVDCTEIGDFLPLITVATDFS